MRRFITCGTRSLHLNRNDFRTELPIISMDSVGAASGCLTPIDATSSGGPPGQPCRGDTMIKLNTAARELMHDTLGIARAALKSAAPSPIGETLRLSRRPGRASHALVCGGALLRNDSFLASPFHNWLRRAAEKLALGFQAQAMRALPQARKRAPKGAMRCVVTKAIRTGSSSGSRAGRACAAKVRFTGASKGSSVPRIIALLRRRRLRQSRKPGVFGEFVRRGEQHFDVRSNAMY